MGEYNKWSSFSAGVGRTGTFIGLWNLMEAIDDGPPASVNVQQTVLAMRERRPSMVQTPVLREEGLVEGSGLCLVNGI